MIKIKGKNIKICIVNVYFGKFPPYFALWLKSAEWNPNIDFLIFSDCKYSPLPKNVKIYDCTLSEIKRRAEEELGFKAALDEVYKCCDYKPIYGKIFKSELAGYDYWGHCDLDLLWGDLETCFVKNNLTAYDRFFFLGHLSLYKNTERVNDSYRLPGARETYKQVYTQPRPLAFDEINGNVQIFLKNRLPIFLKKEFADISPYYKRFKLSTFCCMDGEMPKNHRKQIFYWECGKVYRAYLENGKIEKEEFAYIHFQKRKNFSYRSNGSKNDRYIIYSGGLVMSDGDINIETIKKYSQSYRYYFEWIEYLKMKIAIQRKRVLMRLKYGKVV